jgi:prephenate dehydrogenase
MAGREVSGIAPRRRRPVPRQYVRARWRVVSPGKSARVGLCKILEKIAARPLWLGAPQHDYAVSLASHLPQLAAVALAGRRWTFES